MNEPINAHGQRTTEDHSNPNPECTQANETTEQLADVSTDAQQAEYRRAYLEQLRRMSCPGCGEDPTLPF
jgi:hypothetical protein